jgi:hypothetical protein
VQADKVELRGKVTTFGAKSEKHLKQLRIDTDVYIRPSNDCKTAGSTAIDEKASRSSTNFATIQTDKH